MTVMMTKPNQTMKMIKDEFVKTPSSDYDDEDETKITDKAEGDEDEEMDYTTSQLYDDVDIRMNKPVQADDETVQKKGTNVELTNIQQGNENPEISEVIEDAHVTLYTIPQKTEKLFLQWMFTSIMKYQARKHSHSLLYLSQLSPILHQVSALEKDVSELKKDDPLKTQVTALVDEHLNARLKATRDEFMSYLSTSITARITKQAAATITEFELKKILIDKMEKSKSYLAAPEHRECYEGLIKSYDLDNTLFSTYDKVYSLKRSRKDKDKDEDPSVGSDREEED
ncbi:hypothetical protein Tco_0854423 [Tanacetum coccineum]